MMLREKKLLIQSQEAYTGSLVTYRLLCHYGQKRVFAKEKDDCIIYSIENREKKRTAKCIIIKWIILYKMLLKEGKYRWSEYESNKKNKNDKLIWRRTKRNLFLFNIYICIHLNKRYLHGLFNEFKLLLCIYYILRRRDKKTNNFLVILCKKKADCHRTS
jgi:hypothetical protein